MTDGKYAIKSLTYTMKDDTLAEACESETMACLINAMEYFNQVINTFNAAQKNYSVSDDVCNCAQKD